MYDQHRAGEGNRSVAKSERDSVIIALREQLDHQRAAFELTAAKLGAAEARLTERENKCRELEHRLKKGQADQEAAAARRRAAILSDRAQFASLEAQVAQLLTRIGALEAENSQLSTLSAEMQASPRWRAGKVAMVPLAPIFWWRRRSKAHGLERQVAAVDASGLFDADTYLKENPDVAAAGVNPLKHYLDIGWKESRNAGPSFDGDWYLEQNPDVKDAGVCPLLHYLENGRAEGRHPAPPSSASADKVKGRKLPPAPDLFALRAHSRRAERAVVAWLPDAESAEALRRALGERAQTVDLIVARASGAPDGERIDSITANPATDSVAFSIAYTPAQILLHFAMEGPLREFTSVIWIDGSAVTDWTTTTSALQLLLTAPPAANLTADALNSTPASVAASLENKIKRFVLRLGRRPHVDVDAVYPAGALLEIPSLFIEQLRAYQMRPADLFLRTESVAQSDRTRTIDSNDSRAVLFGVLNIIAQEADLPVQTVETVSVSPTPDDNGASVKTIAFYLPQFHPIAENDAWWGRGFTEWSNVTKARSLFDRHHQPKLPADLGYYDLRNADTQLAQANLAHDHGVYGFCYYYYWFGGKKILNQPIEQMVESGEPDFPFCVCWANENWSRNWDGQNRYVLLKQTYSEESNRALIREFIKLMRDPRYIRFNGKPVLIVYRIRIIPNWRESAEMWRSECRKAGIGEIHLCAVRFGLEPLEGAPEEFGLDAYVLFPPHETRRIDARGHVPNLNGEFNGEIFGYDDAVEGDLERFDNGAPWPVHRGAMVDWDNTARRPKDSRIYFGSTPARFYNWLKNIIQQEDKNYPDRKERLVFINAWNEWAEGAMLEPSQLFGRGYLKAVKRAIGDRAADRPRPSPVLPIPSHAVDASSPPTAVDTQWVNGAAERISGAPTVLLCAHIVSHELFGAERSFLDMLDAMEALRVNVIVALPTDKHPFYTELVRTRSIGVSTIPYEQWSDDREPDENIVAAFNDLIVERDIDVVYANTIVLMEPLIAARRCNRKTLVHARELVDCDDDLIQQIDRPADEIIQQVFEWSDGVVGNSHATEALFHRDGKTFYAPNVIVADDFDIPNLLEDEIRFVIASSNIPKKGVPDFIELARRVETQAPQARFFVVGPDNRYVENWKADNPPGNLSFTHYRETPLEAISLGNVIVSMSHFAESFGRTVAEAAAARRPVIAYAHGAVTELIEDGVTGFLAQPEDIEAAADAVVALCNDPSQIREMGKAARARMIERYSPRALRDGIWRALETVSARGIAARPEVAARPVTIIVPVYNAPNETRDCLESLRATLEPGAARVVVLNDASPDPQVRTLLDEWRDETGFEIVHHSKNMGYTANVNAGLAVAGDDDIVLLNSDAIVTGGFLEGLQRAAYARADIGTATAMSDNAGAFSFPEFNAPNPKPRGISHDAHAAAILKRTSHLPPVEVPTGSGFCMYIRRDMIEAIGNFDENAFPRGYGEENDFCMRGLRGGWRHVISPYAYVFHKRSASFGDAKDALVKAGVDVVTSRYPDYAERTKAAFASEEMSALRAASDWRR